MLRDCLEAGVHYLVDLGYLKKWRKSVAVVFTANVIPHKMLVRRRSRKRAVIAKPVPSKKRTTIQYFSTRCWAYPLAVSGRALHDCCATVSDDRTDAPPVVDLDSVFANPNNVETHTCTVIVGRQKYLVIGYFDHRLPPNYNIYPFCPSMLWRGELAVLSLGNRVRVKASPTGKQVDMQRALIMYVEACTRARAMFQDLPRQIIFNNSIYDDYLLVDA